MRAWFDYRILDYYFEDSNVRLGLGWYWHSKNHKYKGLTIEFYLFKYIVSLNIIDNIVEYNNVINRRYKYQDRLKK